MPPLNVIDVARQAETQQRRVSTLAQHQRVANHDPELFSKAWGVSLLDVKHCIEHEIEKLETLLSLLAIIGTAANDPQHEQPAPAGPAGTQPEGTP